MATRFIDVTFDNGETYTYEGVPFDATPEQAQTRIAQDFPDLLVTSIDGSRTSEGVAPQAPVQPASTPSIVEAARTSQTPVAAPVQALGEGERVVFGDDVVGGNEVAIQQLNPETKAAIEAELATYAGNPEFSRDTVNQIYSKYGVGAAGPTDEKYIQAMQEGRQVGGIPVGEYEAQQKRLEDKAIAAQATEMAKGLEGQGLFSREFEEATLYGFPGWLGNIANDWLDTGKEELRRMYPGESEDWYEEASEKIVTMTQRSLRQAYMQESERNPTWKPDEGMISNIASFRWFPSVAGALLGSAGPEYALMPGATAGARILGQMGISGVAELAYETGDYAMGVNDGISGEHIFASAALGGLFQGGMEGLGRILRGQRSGKDIEAEVEAGPQPTGEVSPIVEEIVSPSRGPTPTEQMEMDFSFEPRQMEMDLQPPRSQAERLAEGLQQMEALKRKRNAPPERTPDVEWRDQDLDLETQLPLFSDLPKQRQGELDLVAPSVPERTVADDVLDSVSRSVEGWTNAPEITVHENFSRAAEDVDPRAMGYMDADTGQVHLNGQRIAEEAQARGISVDEMTAAVVFHESLGHYGLAQKFREDLDAELIRWDKQSPYFKKLVDEWEARSPNAYADDLNPRARAAEEVLAEMSEAGRVPPKLLDKLLHQVKEILRDFGWNINISKKELSTILDLAHERVISGERVDVQGSGKRFMRSYGDSDGSLQGPKNREVPDTSDKRSSLGHVRSNRQLDDIMDEYAPERTKESFSEWIDDAGRIKMTGKAAQALAKGTEPPQLLAAREFGVKSANRIKDLSRKIADGKGTARDEFLLTQEGMRFENIQQSIADVVANAARLTASGRIVVESDKALKDNIRRMMAAIDPNDPTSIRRAAEELAQNEATATARKKRADQLEKILNVGVNVSGMPRSIMSSMDLSAPLRQGIVLSGRKEFWKNLPKMLKLATSEKAFQNSLKEIKARPTYKAMEKSDLAISDMSSNLQNREEMFISDYAQKIPVLGPLIRGSERAYAGFLNNLRADTFDTLVTKAKAVGVDVGDTKELKDIAKFINSATGRGDLGSLNAAAVPLSTLFFSPRLIAARVNMLNPLYYAKLSPFARKEAIKSMMQFGTIALTITALAQAGGADVEADPRSSDFGKIRTGNTRYDLLGGFGQYVTLGARLVTNEKKNARGEVVALASGDNKKPGAASRRDITEQFFRNKFAPIPSYISDFAEGKNAIGEPFEADKAALERMTPLFVQDLIDMTDKYGDIKGIGKTLPSFFGIAIQDYEVKGTDRFGHVFDQEDTTKNKTLTGVVKELEESSGKEVLGWPQRTIKVGDEKRKLTDQEWEDYVAGSSKWIDMDLAELIKTPEWQESGTEDRIEMVRKIAKDARKDAREELFSTEEEQSEEEDYVE